MGRHQPEAASRTESSAGGIRLLSVDAQHAVDEYKARSVRSAWWSLDEKVRRRYFTKDERAFITRYGARLDELACHRDKPRNEKEEHFLKVCVSAEEPTSPRERLWLLVHLVCRYQRSVDRAARADLAEHDAFALRAENKALKGKNDHLERYCYALHREQEQAVGDRREPICNVERMTALFRRQLSAAPMLIPLVSTTNRWPPLTLPAGDA